MSTVQHRRYVEPCLATGAGRASVKGRPTRADVSWCGGDQCSGPRRCRHCKAAYMRAWRAAGRERPGDPQKLRARALVNMRLHRGLMVRKPCEQCGATPAQAHHDDYQRPADVRWLCRSCHRAVHRA